MTIKIEIKEKEGQLCTRVVEEEGATKAVRYYDYADDAITYLTSRGPYYRQPVVAEERLTKGSPGKDENGDDVVGFAHLQAAIAYLRKKTVKPELQVKADEESEKDEGKTESGIEEGDDQEKEIPSKVDAEKEMPGNNS